MSGEHGLPQPENLAALPEDGGPKYNRLIFEQSPYLLQHAENPVDWYPWGEAAFAKAQKENKPVFLSIGYATCHWCHVMAHESFEDPEVAELMNRHFVSIKVDKEERPDIDDIYMTACLALNGHGGWPLTALLMPDQRPFFAATYLPKASRGGRMGMLEFVPRIGRFWRDEAEALTENASRLTATIQQYSQAARGTLGSDALQTAYGNLVGEFDPNYGGFGNSPKFPTAHHSLFLLRSGKQPWGEHAMDMVALTLHAMRHGGLFDHIGYGFHRYSTDQVWLLPHFEKMLYDQAMLAILYAEAFQATQEPLFAQTAREIFTYVLRDMTHPDGGFYSAEDADSEGEEGKFYVWTERELIAQLGQEQAKDFIQAYQVETRGNFREEATGHFTGTSILHLAFDADGKNTLRELQDGPGLRPFEKACEKLFHEREKRIHPLKDDKVLTDWNGLMIAAFAVGARVLSEPAYLDAAQKAAQFIESHLTQASGHLLKRFRKGSAGLPAHLDDYAFYAWGNLELFRSSSDSRYLKRAIDLVSMAKEQFFDEEIGAFYHTAADGEQLIARSMKAHDGAIPSGNSVMAYVMAVLGRLTGNHAYEDDCQRVFDAFAGQLNRQPQSSSFMMMAYDFLECGTQEVVIVGEDHEETHAFLTAANEGFFPNRLVLWKKPGDPGLDELLPFVKDMTLLDGKTTAYLCQNYACEMPQHDLAAFKQRLIAET